ncbi:MAG: hypothetical protein AAFU85_16265 [Planctomycetota bacterium]
MIGRNDEMRLDVRGRATLDQVPVGVVSHMISIGDAGDALGDLRLPGIHPDRHLCLHFRDRKSPQRSGAPREGEIRPLFEWLDAVVPIKALLVHCGAGMSRSPAIAVLAFCHLQPSTDPYQQMLFVESSCRCKHIWPNRLVVQLGDRILERNQAIVDAVEQWRATQNNS